MPNSSWRQALPQGPSPDSFWLSVATNLQGCYTMAISFLEPGREKEPFLVTWAFIEDTEDAEDEGTNGFLFSIAGSTGSQWNRSS
jgi:hypothetical protein